MAAYSKRKIQYPKCTHLDTEEKIQDVKNQIDGLRLRKETKEHLKLRLEFGEIVSIEPHGARVTDGADAEFYGYIPER